MQGLCHLLHFLLHHLRQVLVPVLLRHSLVQEAQVQVAAEEVEAGVLAEEAVAEEAGAQDRTFHQAVML